MRIVGGVDLFLPRLLIRSELLLAPFTAALIIPERGVSERISRYFCQINLRFKAGSTSDPTSKAPKQPDGGRITIPLDIFRLFSLLMPKTCSSGELHQSSVALM